MGRQLLVAAAGLFGALICATSALADVRITDQPYVRHDGGSDLTIASCSSDVTDPAPDAPTPTPAADEGGGERQQNEPTAAVNPLNVDRMTAGANDYCAVPTTTDAWAGFYYSSNRARRGRTACSRLSERHLGRGSRVAAARLRRQRRRSGAGLGSRQPSLLRRNRVQPDEAGNGSIWVAATTGARRSPSRTTSTRRSSRGGRRPRSAWDCSRTRWSSRPTTA